MSDGHDPHHGHDEHGDEHGHGGVSPWIQHHYDDGKHQFDAGKLGIWFFLAQELLFFSALFVAYILYRHHHPEIFAYAHYYLDVKWGAINTAVLIISSLTAAWAVRCAQLNQRRGLIVCLAATLLCACGFLTIKYIEYSHKVHEGILFGKYFDPCISSGQAHLLTRKDKCPGIKRSECRPGNIDQDAKTPGWQVACAVEEVKGTARRELEVCEMERHHHGPPHPKKTPCWEIQQNSWVCKTGEVAALVHYGDHEIRGSSTKIELKCTDAAATPALDFEKPLPQRSTIGTPVFSKSQRPSHHDLEVEKSMGPPPPHTNMFFSIYFAMTGLHGIHVLVGVFVFIWLLFRAIRGDFTPDYFGPVDFAALYWHLVDLIWIFLFPLLYLIH